MQISVFGLGYVGTVCAACLADRGHHVIGVDKQQAKVDLVQSGRSPVIEPEVEELIKRNRDAERLTATTDGSSAVACTEMSIVCVGTPSRPSGEINLQAIESVSAEIGGALRSKTTRHEIVIRSTVIPGTTRNVIAPCIERNSGMKRGDGFGIAFNPEFLRESSSVADFNTPAKSIVGALDETTAQAVMSLFCDLPGAKISTNIETAELIKYVDNAWHALKVTFGNEVGLIASALNIDSRELMRIFCEDRRLNISTAYLQPGFAFGGSCLPKDLRALTYLSRKLDLELPVLNHVLASNRLMIDRGFEWIAQQSKRRIAFLGLSFKGGTDDLRESPFVELAERLLGKGYELRIFDPNVQLARLVGTNKEYLMQVLPHIADLMVSDIGEVIRWAEVIVVTSAEPAYREGLVKVEGQTVLEFCSLGLPDNLGVRPMGFLW